MQQQEEEIEFLIEIASSSDIDRTCVLPCVFTMIDDDTPAFSFVDQPPGEEDYDEELLYTVEGESNGVGFSYVDPAGRFACSFNFVSEDQIAGVWEEGEEVSLFRIFPNDEEEEELLS